MQDTYTKHSPIPAKVLPKRIIQEWDGSTNTVSLLLLPSGDIEMSYDDGLRHIVSRTYLDSITIRTYA